MMEMTKGFVAAPLTGFNQNGSVNLEIIPHYVNMLSLNNVSGVFVNGTTGEGLYLTMEERMTLAECWLASAPKEMKVFIHVGYASPEQSKALAAHAAKIGAAAIGEIGPAIEHTPTVGHLVEYSAATAASASGLPYYYYHMPSINGLHFSIINYLKLADGLIPNLAGIKYTHDDMNDFEQCLRFKDGKYDILFGRDELLIHGLAVGAKGAVGSTYNIITPLYIKLVELFKNGDLEAAKRYQTISAETCKILYESGSFGFGLKMMMRMVGIDLGGMRNPELNLNEQKREQLENALQKTGVLNFLNKT